MRIALDAPTRSETVDPERWLAILQKWHPRMRPEELVNCINEFIEAAGPHRVEGLDDLFVHVDKTTRSAKEKLDKLRQWTKKMRADPRFWPHLFERHRPVSGLIKNIVEESRCPVTRDDVERNMRKYRKVPSTGLSQTLKELADRGEIDRLKPGVYWRRGTASSAYVTHAQRMYEVVYSAPDHSMREAELAVVLGLSRRDAATLVSIMRKRGLFGPATGNGVVVASAESLATLQRGPIFDGRGAIFFNVQEGVAPIDGAVFTALRPERLPLEDAEVEAEIERLKALPLAEYEAERESAASRLGLRLSILDRLCSGGPEKGVAMAALQLDATARPSVILSATQKRLAAEKECEQLLITRYEGYVRNGRKREERPLKDKIRAEAIELIPKLSRRSFDKCWKATAVAQSWDWALPGQR
jgi:hypothetical protein